jgi:hypothetical protein
MIENEKLYMQKIKISEMRRKLQNGSEMALNELLMKNIEAGCGGAHL